MFKQRKGAERVLKAQLCEHSPSADTADLLCVVWSSTTCSPRRESSTAAPAPPPSSLSAELTLLGEMRPIIPDGAPPSPPHAAHAVSAPPSPVGRESERRTHAHTHTRTHGRTHARTRRDLASQQRDHHDSEVQLAVHDPWLRPPYCGPTRNQLLAAELATHA
jgi:hypothetical protein